MAEDLGNSQVSVLAPDGAIGWSVSDGFIVSSDVLSEVRIEGSHWLPVIDGLVLVEGLCPLAALVRSDRDLHVLRQRVAALEAVI